METQRIGPIRLPDLLECLSVELYNLCYNDIVAIMALRDASLHHALNLSLVDFSASNPLLANMLLQKPAEIIPALDKAV